MNNERLTMKDFFLILFSIISCSTLFSQNVIKEYWGNGKLKFVRTHPRIDSIYVYDNKTGTSKLEIIRGFDSINYFTKAGDKIEIDSFISLYGEFEINTNKEKSTILKQSKEHDIEVAKEIKRLDKLVLKTKKKKIFLDTTKFDLKYFYGEGDVCGNKIDGTKFERVYHGCYQSTVKAIVDTLVFDIIQFDVVFSNKLKNENILCQSNRSVFTPAMKMLFSKVTEENRNYCEFIFQDIYLKDKHNNYFKINEYKDFKLFCDK